MNEEFDRNLLEALTAVFDEDARLSIEEFNGRQGLVIEPAEESDTVPEDITVTVEHLPDDITAVQLLATVYSDADESQISEITKLIPYLNEYLVIGHFGTLPDTGFVFHTYAFVITDKLPINSLLRIFAQTLESVTELVVGCKEMLLPLMRGETTAEKMIENDDLLVQ